MSTSTATATQISTTSSVELMGPDELAAIGQTQGDRTVCTTFTDGQLSFREIVYTDWYFEFTHPRYGEMVLLANTREEAHDKIHEMLNAPTRDLALAIANRRSR